MATWTNQDIQALLELTPPGEKATLVAQTATENPQGISEPKPQRLSKSPYARLGLIALICGCGAGLLGLIFSQGGALQLRPTVETGETAARKINSKKPPTLEEKNAQLAGELALAQQQSQMRAIREDLDSRSDIPKVEIVNNDPVQSPATQPATQSVRAAQPRAATVPVSLRTIPNPSPPPTPPRPGVRSLGSPSQATDPFKQWQQLAQLGSYGTTGRERVDTATQSSTPTPSEAGELLLPDEEPRGQADKISSGQRIAGKLESSIIWAEGLKQPISFVVSISQPLSNSQGLAIVPRGSQIVFEMKEVHSSGLVVATAIAILREGREDPLPTNTLQLQGEKGIPLLASFRNDIGSELARRDTSTFLMGALSKVGELINRATSSSTFNGIGGTSQSQTYGSPNYLGAVLEGGFSNLSGQLLSRNQQAIKELRNRPQLWWVEAGGTVEIVVSRSFYLGETDVQEN